jgi:DNA polymerase I
VTLILDALSALHRAFHALPPLTTSRGEPSGAITGVVSLLRMLMREHRPAAIALAFDLPGVLQRREEFPAYKAHRSRAASPLVSQIPVFWALARAAGIPAHAVPGWEADDVVASLIPHLEGDVLVVSGDTDLLQLVGGRVSGLLLGQRGRKNVLLDADGFRARYGYAAAAMPAFKAMVGDPSDGLPGIAGLGAASAKALCAHGDAAGILAALDAGRIGNRRLPPILEANRADLARYEALARLRADLPLSPPFAAAPDLAGLGAFLAKWEIRTVFP